MDNATMEHLDQQVPNTFPSQTATFGGAGERTVGAQDTRPIQWRPVVIRPRSVNPMLWQNAWGIHGGGIWTSMALQRPVVPSRGAFLISQWCVCLWVFCAGVWAAVLRGTIVAWDFWIAHIELEHVGMHQCLCCLSVEAHTCIWKCMYVQCRSHTRSHILTYVSACVCKYACTGACMCMYVHTYIGIGIYMHM